MKDTNDNEIHKSEEKHHEKVNFQTLGNICLMIIAVLIIGNAILIYYMINSEEYDTVNAVEEENVADEDEEVDTVANIINTVVSPNTTNNSVTVDSTDTANRKLANENLIVLYNGLILDTSEMDQVELKYIDNNSTDKDKYVITYYNYENFAFTESSLGTLSQPIYDGLAQIENVKKVAISENYDAIPREIKITNTLPATVSDNNTKLSSEYDSVKTITADLDGNGTEEYIVILANKTTGYSKISLYHSTGSLIDDLAYIGKDKWNTTTNSEYYLSLDNINVIDVDNDGTMEILVEIPKYEDEPSVSILKYKNSELTGKTNIECSLLQ